MPGIRVYFASDQTGILDRHHTRIDFDSVMYDTDGEWDVVNKIWRPKFTVPTIVRLDAHISWTSSLLRPVGYGKIWSHWQRLDGSGATVTVEQLGEGRRDGPLSAANPGISYSDQKLCQPGEFAHMACMFFAGADGHAIQSGVTDDPDGTRRRSFFAASY